MWYELRGGPKMHSWNGEFQQKEHIRLSDATNKSMDLKEKPLEEDFEVLEVEEEFVELGMGLHPVSLLRRERGGETCQGAIPLGDIPATFTFDGETQSGSLHISFRLKLIEGREFIGCELPNTSSH